MKITNPAFTTQPEKGPKATGLQTAALMLLHARLNECRNACPGIGGDIDASNVAFMIQTKEWHPSSVTQAAKTLDRLAKLLNSQASGLVDASDALEAVGVLVYELTSSPGDASHRWTIGKHPGEKWGTAYREIIAHGGEFSPYFVGIMRLDDAERTVQEHNLASARVKVAGPLCWGDDEFATQAETEKAIAEHIVGQLADGDNGSVTKGDKVFAISVLVDLVETEDPT